ncbi:glutamate racemase [Polymorphobacter glacialis]|uniref:Glutamate racemase n=1 Tax=Sandarakinorhabdus glacialis TaxID=1614636 RepID=A0A917A139_9SPHN|nr:glutamate racemase [Polymorphobacter glacialis]GGE20578.1 glutamate racemase [Polymorphobacter glacialis]
MNIAAPPVLIFDSGVGGLSVLGPIRALMPGVSIVYAADNAGFPYGIRSEAEIAARVPALLGRLVERYRPQLAVIACNTASTIALAHVRAALDVPVVGTVPAIKPAAEGSRSRVIGVLGTMATVRQAYVDRLAGEFAVDCTVLRHGSARLVILAEAKLAGETVTAADVAPELVGLTGQPGGERMDMMVLACTHFPLLAAELVEARTLSGLGPLGMVDGGAGIARRVAHLLGGAGAGAGQPGSGRAVFTRADAHVDALAGALQSFGLMTTEIL